MCGGSQKIERERRLCTRANGGAAGIHCPDERSLRRISKSLADYNERSSEAPWWNSQTVARLTDAEGIEYHLAPGRLTIYRTRESAWLGGHLLADTQLRMTRGSSSRCRS